MAGADPWAVASVGDDAGAAPTSAQDPWSVQGAPPSADSPYLGMIENAEGSAAAANAWNNKHPNAPITAHDVVSPAGAVGLYQVTPNTAKLYGFDPGKLHDPAYNRMVANTILSDLQSRYGNDHEAIGIAYNAGTGAADRWRAAKRDVSVLPAETQGYIKKLSDPWAVQGVADQPAPQDTGGTPPPFMPAPLAHETPDQYRARVASEAQQRAAAGKQGAPTGVLGWLSQYGADRGASAGRILHRFSDALNDPFSANPVWEQTPEEAHMLKAIPEFGGLRMLAGTSAAVGKSIQNLMDEISTTIPNAAGYAAGETVGMDQSGANRLARDTTAAWQVLPFMHDHPAVREAAERAGEQPVAAPKAAPPPPPPPGGPPGGPTDELLASVGLRPKPAAPAAPAPARAPATGPIRPLDTDVAYTPSGREVPVRYAVVEADRLTPSQTDEGNVNQNYPQELQPRDRTRAVSQNQIAQIAQNLNPKLLDRSANAGDGAPIISADGIVESGNGRTLAIQRAYRAGMPSADGYRDYLAAQGYPVQGMKAPVLVRIREGDMAPDERQAFVREANQPAQLGYSATEQAMADARAIPDEALQLYRGGDVEQVGNRDFVRAFVRAAVPDTEQARLFDKNGMMSQEAIRRVRAGLFAKAYGDPELTSQIAENPDSNIKAIGGALTDVAPDWAQMRSMAANGAIPPELDQTPHLLEAARIVAKARSEGIKLGDLINQRDMLTGDAVDPDVEGWLRLMYRDTTDWTKPVGRDRLSAALRYYAQQAQQVQPGANLLGLEPLGPREIRQAARERQYAEGQQPGFSEDLAGAAGANAGAHGGFGAGPESQGYQAPGSGGGPPAGGAGTPQTGEIAPRPFAPLPRGWTMDKFDLRSLPNVNRPLTDNMRAYMNGLHVNPMNWRDVMPAMASYVHDRGMLSGHESIGAWDPSTGEAHAATSGDPRNIGFPDEVMASFRDGTKSIVTVHNHPSSYPPSSADMMSLAYPGQSWMTVVGHDGSFTAARLAAVRRVSPTQVSWVIDQLLGYMGNAVRPHVRSLRDSGALGNANASVLHNDLVLHALDRAGVIDYITTRPLPPELQNTTERAIRDATNVAHTKLREFDAAFGESLRPVPRITGGLYRPTDGLRFSDAVARVFGEGGGNAGEAAAAAGGEAGARAGAGVPYRRPEQLRLLENDKDMFATEPGAVDAQGRPLPQTIMPGMERSARQLAAARELLGKGKKVGKAAQAQNAGPLFGGSKIPHPEMPDLFKEGEETFGGGEGGGEPPSGGEPPEPPDRDRGNWLRRQFQTIAPNTADSLRSISNNAKMLVSPMTVGLDAGKAAAKDFSNLIRYARDVAAEDAARLRKNFTPEQRKKMWLAGDEESIAMQRGETDLSGIGLERLEPEERAALERQQLDNQQAFAAGKAAGLIREDTVALPSYMPHLAVEITSQGAKAMSAGDVRRNIPGIGKNLRTSIPQLRYRKYTTAEEMEEALARGGKNAMAVRDVQTLPYVTGRLREATAGRVFLNKLEELGKASGAETVVDGYKPGEGWFTINHPSFFTWWPDFTVDKETGKQVSKVDQNGDMVFQKVPRYVHGDLEGPVRAVLTGDDDAVYRAMMDLKGKAMNSIMFSPLVQLHLLTELGRSMPAAPFKVATGKILFEGYAAKNDPAIRREAIMNGLVPIRHQGAMQDITSIPQEEVVQPGHSWTAKVAGAIPGLFDRISGTNTQERVYRGVDAAGDFLHNTLLWDRVADLQFGLYKNLKQYALDKGLDDQTAGRMAAHWANRYAGTLPAEAMSTAARKIANLALFSRTYTLGNLGVMKDLINGMPEDVRAQISRDAGDVMAEKAQSLGKRKARGMMAMDLAYITVSTELLSGFFNYATGQQTTDQIMQGYVDRWHQLEQKAMTSPLAVLNPLADLDALSVTHENEIDPHTGEPINRILIGHEKDGTAIYVRNPLGKYIDEAKGWVSNPAQTLINKLSNFTRPIYDVIVNDAGNGKHIYDARDSLAQKIGNIAWHYMKAQVPSDQIKSAYDLLTGQAKAADALKLAGRVGGLTFRHGSPGGPAMGDFYRMRDEEKQQVMDQMPQIREKILGGNISGAHSDMRKLNMNPDEINAIVHYTLNPKTRLLSRSGRQVIRNASPEERERFQRDLRQ